MINDDMKISKHIINIAAILSMFMMMSLSGCASKNDTSNLKCIDYAGLQDANGDSGTVKFLVEWENVVWTVEEVPGADGSFLSDIKPKHAGVLDNKGYTTGSVYFSRNETGKTRQTTLLLKPIKGSAEEVHITVTQLKYTPPEE